MCFKLFLNASGTGEALQEIRANSKTHWLIQPLQKGEKREKTIKYQQI